MGAWVVIARAKVAALREWPKGLRCGFSVLVLGVMARPDVPEQEQERDDEHQRCIEEMRVVILQRDVQHPGRCSI